MKKDDCIFCKIANGLIPSDTVYEDEHLRAILDLSPAAKGHTLVIPKEHCEDVFDADEDTLKEVFLTASRIAKAVYEAVCADGVNIVQNNKAAAGQTVGHLHVHIIPRFADGERMLFWNQHESDPKEREAIAGAIAARL